MKKFLLSLVACAAAFTASAGGNGGTSTPYWFTVNVETEAQPTGAGKVYCSFESADAAKANQTTAASKHFSGNVSNNNWGGVTQTVLLYAESEDNYEFDHYEVNGRRVDVTDNGYGDGYRIAMTQANNCGAGDLAEGDCVAQHSEELAGVVTHVVGVFKEIEKCWFYASAQVGQVEGGTVSISFESEEDAAQNVNTTASVHFNKSVAPGDYSAVTKNLYIHVAPSEGYALNELTINGAPMQVNENGDVIYFARMTAANKCGDGALTEEECLAQHNVEGTTTAIPVNVAVKFDKITAITDVKVSNTTDVKKVIENGQVIIVKGENRYNTMGQSVK